VKVWITTVGTSVFAVVNPLWAACIHDGFAPERIHLLKNTRVEHNVPEVRAWLTRILKCYGVEPEFVEHEGDEDDMSAFARLLRGVVESEKGNEIAIDMTPGRKFMSAYAMFAGLMFGVSKVYYLHLYDLTYQNQAYVLIPFNHQKLVNVLDYARGGADG